MLCAVVRARGSTPQSAGALMVVDQRGELHGTIGGGCVEAEVRRRSLELLHAGRSGVLRFTLDHDFGWDDGLICGGTLEVAAAPLPAESILQAALDRLEARVDAELELAVEHEGVERRWSIAIPPRDRLLIAGAGHVGQALARLALRLEFEVVLFDDRADLLARFAPEGCATVAGEIGAALRAEPVDLRTCGVVVTRGHRNDEQALEALLGRGARSLGMIGSRRKVKLIFDELIERGADPSELARVNAPIGLPIGSVTVEEIALSIAAQLVALRREERFVPVRELAPPERGGSHRESAERVSAAGAPRTPTHSPSSPGR